MRFNSSILIELTKTIIAIIVGLRVINANDNDKHMN